MARKQNKGNRTALVTGASRGIGRSIAVRLAREGYNLLITGRSEQGLRGTEDAVRSEAAEVRIELLSADIARPETPGLLRTAVESKFAGLDVLVNNAGTACSGSFGSYSLEEWETVMNLNARAPFLLMQEFLPLLEQASPGYIINIGSVVSKKGYADQALYAASKHALLGLTKSAARDLAPRGIRVHAVLPGGVDTDMVRSVRPDIDGSEMISPQEVADAVAFLIAMRGNAVVDELSLRRRTKPAWD